METARKVFHFFTKRKEKKNPLEKLSVKRQRGEAAQLLMAGKQSATGRMDGSVPVSAAYQAAPGPATVEAPARLAVKTGATLPDRA